MATTKFTDNVTPIIASFMNDVDVATYENLTNVVGTNTITATGPAGMSAYANTSFEFIATGTNTGAVTINITPLGASALGAAAVTKNGSTALVAGDLVAGTAYRIVYDGTRYQVLNPSSVSTSSLANNLSGGSGGTIPYQSATNTTTMLPNGTAGQLLTSNGGTLAPSWTSTSSILLLRGYIDGLTMSTAGASTTLSISAGQAVDSANAVFITLSSSINKTTSAWAVGSGNGGLDTGTIANSTWYYFYLIRRPDTGVVDAVFSTNSSTPTLPTNYTQYRYIGAALTNGSGQWTSFRQVGDYFVWNSPVLDIDALTTATATLSTLSVPRGRKILARFNIYGSDGTSGATGIYISDPDTSDDAPSTTLAPLATLGGNGAASEQNTAYAECFTNTSAQIRRRGRNATNYCRLATVGWVDLRGKNV